MKRFPLPTRQRSDAQGTGHASGSIDSLYLLDVIRSELVLIGSITAFCLIGMFILLHQITPTFTAATQVILDSRDERASPVEKVVSNLSVNSSVLAGEVVSIRSNVLIGQVVDQLDLTKSPSLDPRQPRPEGWFMWFSRMLGGAERPSDIYSRMSNDQIRTMVISAVQDQLEVSAIGVSYAISIGFSDRDPVVAAQVANAIARQYMISQLDAKKAASLRANTWLSDRIIELSHQVETADAAVVQFRTKMAADAGGGQEITNQLLGELNSKLVSTSTERADAEVRFRMVEGQMSENGLAAVADVVTSPLLETLQRQLTEDLAKQAQLGSTLGGKHPEMIQIGAQIEDLKRSIDAELRRRIEAMSSDVKVTRNREAALLEQIAVVSARADQLSRASVRLDQLERTASATRLVYENFLSRFKETSAQGDFQTPEARVIGEAQVPMAPSSPRKGLLMAVAGFFGLSLSLALVFLRNVLRSPIRTSDDLRELSSSPQLAMLPQVSSAGLHGTWLENELLSDGPSSFMEGIRAIRTKLFAVPRIQRPRVLMVTSTLAGEGKSSLCYALAHVLQRQNSKVVLLDADLRRSDTVSALSLPSTTNCLVDFLEGKSQMKGLIEHSDLLGVDIVVPTRMTSRGADLLASQVFNGLITQLSARYDIVIINAPPVLDLSDTLLLAKLADATIFAVQSGRAPAKFAGQALVRLNEAGAVVVGTVMTRVRRKDAAAREVYGYSYY